MFQGNVAPQNGPEDGALVIRMTQTSETHFTPFPGRQDRFPDWHRGILAAPGGRVGPKQS